MLIKSLLLDYKFCSVIGPLVLLHSENSHYRLLLNSSSASFETCKLALIHKLLLRHYKPLSAIKTKNSENRKLHIFFLPFLADGHFIPTVDMAKIFAARGIRATIVTTPFNVPLVSTIIGKSKLPSNPNINIVSIKFPSLEAGLPEGYEHVNSVPSASLIPNFSKATTMLQESFEQLLQQHHPDCLIADMFFEWATDSADKFGIPGIVFHGTSSFSLCAAECIRLYEPHKNVSSESEPFVIPNLPGEIKLTRMALPEHILNDDEESTRERKEMAESVRRSFGVIVNSFYGLEQIYADHYQKLIGRKAWHIGPVSLLNKEIEEKANRGKEASIDEQECLKWLDSKKTNSVLYLCFGSMANFTDSQLKEIAVGLKASRQDFIWVVRRAKKAEQQEEEWLPEGFKKRIEGKGLIIGGWAPQVLFLGHQSTGGFVTHCGWNSTLEGVSAGVPMVTWPVSAEQFYNEKLVTEVLRIGVPVGAKKWVRVVGDSVEKEAIEKAVRRVMVGEEAQEIRNRAQKLASMAREAMEDGGSSSLELDALIQQLSSRGHR